MQQQPHTGQQHMQQHTGHLLVVALKGRYFGGIFMRERCDRQTLGTTQLIAAAVLYMHIQQQ